MYAKVFRSLWDGTLANPWQGWAVLVFLLAHSDREGFIDMTPEAIARRSGLKLADVNRGISILEDADPESRTADEEGRRIIRLHEHRSWGWKIVNKEQYRDLTDVEHVREQNRARQRARRERLRAASRDSHAPSRHTDVDVDVDVDKNLPPSPPARAMRSLPVKGGGSFDITEHDVLVWKRIFPSIDIEREISLAAAWLDANPKRIKTARGYPRFFHNWLSRAAAKARPRGHRSKVDERYRRANARKERK